MDKATLTKKSVLALERLAKKVGAKTVTPEGKKKNKTQLVNSIIMAERLGKKNPALKAKKAPAKKVVAKKPTAKKAVRKPLAKKTGRRLLAGRTKADYIQEFARVIVSRYQIDPKKSFDALFNQIAEDFGKLGVRSSYERVGELNFFDWRNAPRQPKNVNDLAVLAFENLYTDIKTIFDRQKEFIKK
jgi:hypothetical protein